MELDDLKLIKRILNGDDKATDVMYKRYERIWFRLCLRYGRNRSDAEDIMQDGLLMIFRDLRQHDSQRGVFKRWSNRIMVNAALKYLKKHQWQQSFEDLSAADSEAQISQYIIETISAKELTLLIQQLPSGYRQIFNMYEIEGYSHLEIAEALNITVSTSKSQLFKAKKSLRQQLEFLLSK